MAGKLVFKMRGGELVLFKIRSDLFHLVVLLLIVDSWIFFFIGNMNSCIKMNS